MGQGAHHLGGLKNVTGRSPCRDANRTERVREGLGEGPHAGEKDAQDNNTPSLRRELVAQASASGKLRLQR